MMPIRDSIQRYDMALKAAPTRAPGRLRAFSSQYERWDIPEPSLSERQANLYANLAWIQIATAQVAQAVASTPFAVQQRTKAGLKQIEDHPFEMLLEQPNDLQDQSEFVGATAAWRIVTGNCYWWLNRGTENVPPEEIWIIPSNKIQPVPDGNMGVRGYLFDNGSGQPVPLESWEVVHFKTFNPLNKYVGLSPIQSLAIDATGDLGAQRYNANAFADGSIKLDGFLAFADAIDDGRWNRLREDQKESHGGTRNQRMAMLRNVGAGGVQWISTAMTRADLQYLEQRRFTMEEAYALIAPGLASVLAINATEANSTAGKDTFLSMAVYPQTYAIGKKITQKVLPAYGTGLVGEFEDVRRVDTQIELLEQAAYERTHTVEETRAKYYQDKPLGDARDSLLPAEIGKGMTDGRAPEDKPAPVMPPQFGAPAAEPSIVDAGKALDRQRWQTVAIKALAAGRSPDANPLHGQRPFEPHYLDDDETFRIRAALKRAQTAADVQAAFGEVS
jgi:HK97 family phage portal protein